MVLSHAVRTLGVLGAGQMGRIQPRENEMVLTLRAKVSVLHMSQHFVLKFQCYFMTNHKIKSPRV